MSILARRRLRGKALLRGQAVIEMLLVMIPLVVIILGGIEFSRAVAVHDALDSAVGIGVRALSLDPGQWDWVQTNAKSTLDQDVFGTTGVGTLNLIATNGAGDHLTPAALNGLVFGDEFCLEGYVYWQPDVPFLLNQLIKIDVRHCGIVERMN